jgi:hypothetical protein
VHPRRTLGGQLTGARLADDPLPYTGGHHRAALDLLFDVTLAGSSIQSGRRDLTRPLWDSPKTHGDDGSGQPPRAFRVGTVEHPGGAAVAERPNTLPRRALQRSWLRMRLLRVRELATPAPAAQAVAGAVFGGRPVRRQRVERRGRERRGACHIGGGSAATGRGLPEEPGAWTERLTNWPIAFTATRHWRVLAAFNDIDDPLHLSAGGLLRILPLSALAEKR